MLKTLKKNYLENKNHLKLNYMHIKITKKIELIAKVLNNKFIILMRRGFIIARNIANKILKINQI